MRSSMLLLAALLSVTISYAQSDPLAHVKAAKKLSKISQPAFAKAVHQSALIVDTHADTTQHFSAPDFDFETGQPIPDIHESLRKIKAGNLGAQFFSIWVDPRYNRQFAVQALRQIDSVYQQAAKHSDRMMMAFSASDILAAHRQKKLAALMGIEGGHVIENDMGLLRDYYRLGVRYMTLTWSNTNEWADSSGDVTDPEVRHHDGLTQFGREVVREMNRLGMMVDISHVSDKTFWDTLTISRAPVIASHSSARALTDHPRNMTDDMLRAMKRNGGVVMVNFFPVFIDENYRKAYMAAAQEERNAEKELSEKMKDADPATQYRERDRMGKKFAARFPRPPLKSLIDHIDHIAQIAGVDHVGLGSDFDGVTILPEGIDGAEDLPKITEELLKRGYSAEDVHKILGGNIMRVFREVEQMSKKIAAEDRPFPLLHK